MKKETLIHIERSGPEPRYTAIPQVIMRPHQEIRVILIEETADLKPIEEETAPEGYEVGSFPGEKINEPIPAKGINEWEGWRPHKHIEEEPELNEEAISKLCDDLIEAKKEPLSAAQIIDKYARRD